MRTSMTFLCWRSTAHMRGVKPFLAWPFSGAPLLIRQTISWSSPFTAASIIEPGVGWMDIFVIATQTQRRDMQCRRTRLRWEWEGSHHISKEEKEGRKRRKAKCVLPYPDMWPLCIKLSQARWKKSTRALSFPSIQLYEPSLPPCNPTLLGVYASIMCNRLCCVVS